MRLLLAYTTPFRDKYTPVESQAKKNIYLIQYILVYFISPAVILALPDLVLLVPLMYGEVNVRTCTVQV